MYTEVKRGQITIRNGPSYILKSIGDIVKCWEKRDLGSDLKTGLNLHQCLLYHYFISKDQMSSVYIQLFVAQGRFVHLHAAFSYTSVNVLILTVDQFDGKFDEGLLLTYSTHTVQCYCFVDLA